MDFSITRLLNPFQPRAGQRPAAPAAPAPAPVEVEDVLSLKQFGREVKVTPEAHLTVIAKPGDTYWGFARRFAATTRASGKPSNAEILAYVKDLEAANGKRLLAGQSVKIPQTPRATFALPALIATQRDLAARDKAGEAVPKLDWSSAQARWGYAESLDVTVKPLGEGQPVKASVRESGPATFRVATTLPAKAPQSAMRLTDVADDAHLKLTVAEGDTHWAIARRFAAARRDPAAPSAAEVRAYIADIRALNGPALKAGQTLKLPLSENAGFMLKPMIAAQQDWVKRGELGHDTPALDWSRASAKWDYAESVLVEVPGKPGAWSEAISVRERGLNPRGTEYEVGLRDEFYRQQGLE